MSLGQRVAGALGDESLHDTIGKAPAASVQVTFPRPDAVVATVSAPVDRDTVDQLETMLWPQPTSTARLVVVDLTEVRAEDSNGAADEAVPAEADATADGSGDTEEAGVENE